MIDWSKPIECMDGTPAALVLIYPNASSTDAYAIVDIPSKPYAKNTSTEYVFNQDGMHTYGKGFQLRNKEMKMIDVNKPVLVGTSEAKIVHTFADGRMAVVMANNPNVLTFDKDGFLRGVGELANKVDRIEKFINVYPDNYGAGTVNQKTSFQDALGGRGVVARRSCDRAFTVKQTFEDGKLISTEIVDV